MTTTSPHTPQALDARRWPDVARVPGVPLRALAARALTGYAAARAGVRVHTGPEDPGPDPGGDRAGAPVLWLRDPDAFHRRLAAGGLIGFGESYMAGEWDSPDPVALLTRLAGDYANLVPRPLQPLRHVTLPRRPPSDRNTRAGARRHISHHYDLSNDLFAVFLDRTMTYSSGLFAGDEPRDRETLARAQERKIDRLLDGARVTAGTRLLEIGTGWG
ncbi:class I SAM-dependent methyltransferase, partial [Nocardiopsis tropica]|nr:class I SAM-dependent methyltransferase [Nocardiopsis tropica]